jgi:hypothetical protein
MKIIKNIKRVGKGWKLQVFCENMKICLDMLYEMPSKCKTVIGVCLAMNKYIYMSFIHFKEKNALLQSILFKLFVVMVCRTFYLINEYLKFKMNYYSIGS